MSSSVQVSAWNAVRVGTIPEEIVNISRTIADAAIGGAMIDRRRAITSGIMSFFFDAVGHVDRHSLEQAQTSIPSRESCIASANLKLDLAASHAPDTLAIAYERGLVSLGEKRFDEAIAHFKRVSDMLPGFIDAGLKLAKTLLAVGRPDEAINVLRRFEIEAREIRAACLLWADCLRALGQPQMAAEWDSLGLRCPGFRDSRGNECMILDAHGALAVHERMPPAFTLASNADGSLTLNDRGLYFSVPALLGSVPTARLLQRAAPAPPRNTRFPRLHARIQKLKRVAKRLFSNVFTLVLFRLWKMLPASVRTLAHRTILLYVYRVVTYLSAIGHRIEPQLRSGIDEGKLSFKLPGSVPRDNPMTQINPGNSKL